MYNYCRLISHSSGKEIVPMKSFAAAIFQKIRVCKVQKSKSGEWYPGRYGKRAARERRELHDIALLSNRSTFENMNLRKRFGLEMVDIPFQGPFASSPRPNH
jgi:hypothetical protein